jgi:DNA-directed RNA polymerase III subunit RPC2
VHNPSSAVLCCAVLINVVGGQMGYSGYCKLCESEKAVRRITMPYAAKLLIQELGSMNVKVTIGLADEFPRES